MPQDTGDFGDTQYTGGSSQTSVPERIPTYADDPAAWARAGKKLKRRIGKAKGALLRKQLGGYRIF